MKSIHLHPFLSRFKFCPSSSWKGGKKSYEITLLSLCVRVSLSSLSLITYMYTWITFFLFFKLSVINVVFIVSQVHAAYTANPIIPYSILVIIFDRKKNHHKLSRFQIYSAVSVQVLFLWIVKLHRLSLCLHRQGQSGHQKGNFFIFSFPFASTDLYPLAISPVEGKVLFWGVSSPLCGIIQCDNMYKSIFSQHNVASTR